MDLSIPLGNKIVELTISLSRLGRLETQEFAEYYLVLVSAPCTYGSRDIGFGNLEKNTQHALREC